MITNTLQQIWCEVAYIGAILAHLRDIPDYHFIGTCSNSEGIFELPEWGDHVIPLNTQPEQSTAIDPALLAKIHSLWTQHVSNETKKLRRLPLGPIHDVPIMPYRPPEKRSIDVFFC